MPRIRVIKKKKKSPKERFIDFSKSSYGKKVISAVVIIFILIIILFALDSDPTGYHDYLGKEKRTEYLMSELESLKKNKSKELSNAYPDGYCIFAIHNDELYYSEPMGSHKVFSVEWDQTKFTSTKDKIEIQLPIIYNQKDNTKISSRSINIKNNQDYSFNTISGTNLIIKAEITRHGGYGDMIIVGIQTRIDL